MKKLVLILAMISMAAFTIAQDHTYTIKSGGSTLSWGATFTAADSIVTSDSLVLAITNVQKYMQNQTFTATIDDVDGGSPSIVITARGKVTSTDNWHPIGTPVTWTGESGNPVVITSTAPVNYNYLKVSFVASGATQHSKLLTFDVRTSNAFDVPTSAGTITLSRPTSGTVTLTSKDNDSNAALTIAAGGTGALTLGESTSATALTGSAVNINASANIATNVNTGTSTGALSLGGGSGTVAIASTGLDLSAGGALTNAASMQFVQDGDSLTINPYKALKLIDARVGGQSKFYADSTGKVWAAGNAVVGGTLAVTSTSTLTGAATFTGGFVPPSASPLIWSQGGSTVLATSGTDTQPAAGTRYWVEVYIPYNVTITGASYLIGSVGGTDSVVVQLCNSSGVEVATTKTTGATHGVLVGTSANLQSIPFTTPYAAVAGKYFLAVQFSGTTCRFRTYPIPGSKFVASSAAGTWNTKADITPGTTFTADKGPITRLY